MDPPRYGRFRDGRAGRPDRAARPDRHPRPGGTTQARLSITTAGVQSGCGQIRAVTGPRIYPPANRGAMFLRFPGERPACVNPAVHQMTVTAVGCLATGQGPCVLGRRG